MQKTLIQAIASEVNRYHNLCDMPHGEPQSAVDAIDQLEKMLPSGSGIDCGTKILLDECEPNKIVLYVEYHHVNDGGFYCGWSGHKLIVTPCFDGIGINFDCDYCDADLLFIDDEGNEIDDTDDQIEMLYDHLAEIFDHALGQAVSYEFDHATKTGRYEVA